MWRSGSTGDPRCTLTTRDGARGRLSRFIPWSRRFPKGAFRGMDASRLGAAVPYMVQLKKGKKIVPCPIDDPDFIRAKGAKYQTGAPPGSRLATRSNAKSDPDPTIGSPARFARSGSRTRAGAAAGGSSACSDTSEIRGKPRTAARTTSPRTESDSTARWSARRTSWYPDNNGYIRTSAKFRDRAAADAIEAANAAGHTRPGREQLDAVVGAYKESVAADAGHVAALDDFIALLEKTVQLAVVGLGSLPEKRVRRAIRALNPRKLPRKGDARKARTVLLKLLIQECKNDAKYEQRFRDMLEDMKRDMGEQYDISDIYPLDSETAHVTIGRRNAH